jgi:hypothetical protein
MQGELSCQGSNTDVTTRLDKELKRQLAVDGADYTVAIDPSGLRVTGKGRRKPQVELRWQDLLNGEAALATALNASLLIHTTRAAKKTAKPHIEPSPIPKQQPRKRQR